MRLVRAMMPGSNQTVEFFTQFAQPAVCTLLGSRSGITTSQLAGLMPAQQFLDLIGFQKSGNAEIILFFRAARVGSQPELAAVEHHPVERRIAGQRGEGLLVVGFGAAGFRRGRHVVRQ